MYPARFPLRFWLVGMAVVFFIAGVFFRVSAAGPTETPPRPDSFLTYLLLACLAFTMAATALSLVSFYRKNHSESYKLLHKTPPVKKTSQRKPRRKIK